LTLPRKTRQNDEKKRTQTGNTYISHQLEPNALHIRHMRLSSQLSLTPHFERDARDLGGEGPEPDDHAVDGVLEIQDLASSGDLDLFGEIAQGDGFRDFGDRTHLARQVRGELVHDARQFAPGAFDV
jgi:hypothetical protein